MRGLEVKRALSAVLTGYGSWPAGTRINAGYATEAEDIGTRDVRVTRIRSTGDYHALGGLHKQESIVLEVVCSARVEGDDQISPEDRAWELADHVETALEANPTVSLTGVGHPYPLRVTSARGEASPDPGGWVQQVVLEVSTDVSN